MRRIVYKNSAANGLLTILLLFFLATQVRAQTALSLHWNDSRAVSAWIPATMLKHYPVDQDSAFLLSIRLPDATTSVIGRTAFEPDGISFSPALPFSQGNTYQVFWRGEEIGRLTVPVKDAAVPELHIYPSADTVPENLLKIYLAFTEPMQEGQSDRYIRLIVPAGDTLRDVFLFLTPELWNADNTLLTLWLDPGRIKRDLLPNQLLGAPLNMKQEYNLTVLPGWRSKQGKAYPGAVKKIMVTSSDRSKPDIDSWKVSAPGRNSIQPLVIAFDETIDFGSALGAINLFTDEGNKVPGTGAMGQNETQWEFIPSSPWVAGEYVLKIDATVEDLAGNNLVRLFDVELSGDNSSSSLEGTVIERPIRVK